MRTEQIRERLTKHFKDELGCVVITPNQWGWAQSHIDPRWRFGWMPPVAPDSDTIFFCPELLDRITEALDEDDLDSYLLVIELYLDRCLAHRDWPIEEIDRAVESELHEHAPFALTLWSETDARALDAQIVSS
jgi:hypothetical protein